MAFSARDMKLLNSNFRLLSKDLEKLSFNVDFAANIASFNEITLRRTRSLISIYWKLLRNKGVNIALDEYKTFLKRYLLYRSEQYQRARHAESGHGVRAG